MIKEIDVSQLQAWREEGKSVRLVDIRSEAEFAAGMIPGAEKLPMHLIPLKLNEFSSDELVVLYCRSGARSAQATGYMQQQGYDQVYNLRGGIITWARSGLPLVA